MASQPTFPETSLPFAVEASAGNHLAWINTALGLQRTLMAAKRTAATLIVLGFTLAQLFQNLQSQIPPRLLALGPHIPRDVGLLMIAAGAGSIGLFTWQYQRAVAYLVNGPFAAISLPPPAPLHQLSCITAYAIMAIGVLAFASIFIGF